MLSDAETNVQQLMHFSTKPSTAASRACQGSFSRIDAVEYVLLTHDALELYRLDPVVGNTLVHRQSLHATLMNIATIPCDQMNLPDVLALTSESGFLTLLRFVLEGEHGEWKNVGSELIGRSGIRSTVPGEYLCVDPEGRCVFVAAPYKEKLIFRLKPSVDGVVLQSPLEARRLTCVFSAVAVNCVGASPMFATLEASLPGPNVPQAELGKKHVCFYTYDTNLNQIRTIVVAVPGDATYLAPCYNATPGVLVCTPFTVMWLGVDAATKGYIEIPLPKRQDDRAEYNGALITGSAFFKSTPIFFLIQNEFGDLFRVKLDDKVSPIDYFGRTQSCVALLILKGGILMSASETGDHQLHKITRDKFPSSQLLSSATLQRGADTIQVPTYSTFDNTNMVQQHIALNTSPCYAMRMGSAVRGRRRYFSLTHAKQLHCTSYGLSTNASAGLSISRQGVDALFLLRDPQPTSRDGAQIEWHSRVLVSHRQESTVYRLTSTEDNRLPEVPETMFAFDNHCPTILAMTMDNGCFLQVTPTAVHAIRGMQRFSWYAAEMDPSIVIHRAAANKRQIVISFVRGGVATFDFDSRAFILRTVKVNLNLPHVSVVTIPPVRGGTLANVVGIAIEGSKDERKERFATFTFDGLRQCSKPLDTTPQGEAGVIRYVSALATYLSDGKLYIFLGTSAGQLICGSLNAEGDIASVDQYQLGENPCQLIAGDGATYCYARSDEVWRCNFDDGAHHRIPVSLPFPTLPGIIERFDTTSGREGLVAISGDKLVPLTVNVGGGSLYTTQSVQLHGTGRKMERLHIGGSTMEVMVIACRDGEGASAKSILQIQDTALQFTSTPEVLPSGDSIVSLTTGVIPGLGESPVVLVGIAHRFSQSPALLYGECRIALFTLNGTQLVNQQMYSTPIPDLPSALHITRTGHVVVGMGEEHGLLVLQCGRTRLLQKHRLMDLESRILALDSSDISSPYLLPGEVQTSFLLACGTSDRSVSLVRYHHTDSHQFLVRVAMDAIPRSIVALRFVTNSSIVCSDRFGNITFLAIPSDAITDIPDGGLRDDTESQRQSQQLRCTGQFHVGQLVNSLDIVSAPKEGGAEQSILVYSTILGAAGCFVPFQKEEDAVLGVLADGHIKSALPLIINRTPYAHQSSFYPPCGVIDGDLWQQYVASKPSEDSIKRIIEDARASDNRLALLVGNTEIKRFSDVKSDTLVGCLKALIGRTKPPSIF